jgi:chromosome segregation ATPase
MFALENESIAATDVLQQMQAKAATAEAELESCREALAKACRQGEASALQVAELSAQARTLRAAVVDAREREDEMSLQLLNLTNAVTAGQARERDAETRLAALQVEEEAQRGRAEAGAAAAAVARAEAAGLAEQVATLRGGVETQALALQRDRLALQRSAVETAETQLSRVVEAEARADAISLEKLQAERERDEGAARAQAEIGRMREVEGALQARLAEHAAQVEALQRHVELLRTPGGISEEDRREAVEGVRMMKLKDVKAALVERGKTDKGKKEELTLALEEVMVAELEAGAAERAAAEAVARGADPAEAFKVELVLYERQLNMALEANRGLVEAYWRVRAVAGEENLPSHVELMGAAGVDVSTGRRAVMSEFEKGLARERDRLAGKLAAAEAGAAAAAGEALGEVSRHRASLREVEEERDERESEVRRVSEAAAKAEARAGELARRMEEAVRDEQAMLRRQGEESVELQALRKAMAALEAEKGALLARIEEAEGRAPPLGQSPGGYQAALAERNAQLRELKWKVAEHTQSEAALERERTEMKRRACAAEDQLAELQRYLSSNIARCLPQQYKTED